MERETDFRNAKVGDRVWDFGYGWGTITEINDARLTARADCHETILSDLNGHVSLMPIRTLFWSEIPITPPPRPKRMVKKVLDGWLNIYKGGTAGSLKETELLANQFQDPGRIACVHIVQEYEVEE